MGAEDSKAHPLAPSSLAQRLHINITGELLCSSCHNEISQAQCLEIHTLTPVSHGVSGNEFFSGDSQRESTFLHLPASRNHLRSLMEGHVPPLAKPARVGGESASLVHLSAPLPSPCLSENSWTTVSAFKNSCDYTPSGSPSTNSPFKNFQQQSHRQRRCPLVGCSQVVRIRICPWRRALAYLETFEMCSYLDYPPQS